MGSSKSKVASTELTPKQIALLRANTKYTDGEIQQWHEGFLRDCPNGRLDKKQFLAVYTKFYPQGNAKDYCKYAFEAFDDNNDGTIDFNEFLLSVSASSQGDLDDRLAVAFDLYDVSDDGQIDQKELSKMIAAIYSLTGVTERSGDYEPKKRAASIVTQLDINSDRKLTREEFISGCKNDPVIRQALAPNT